MSSINKKIEKWNKAGLISQEQSEKLKSYEAQSTNASWILNGILIAAAAAIGIGIISLIASNWYNIPAGVKLGTNFAWLSVLVACIYKNYTSGSIIGSTLKNFSHNIQEALLFLFLISCMGTIGLISQIYHTGGNWAQALLFWSFIIFPSVLISKGFVVPSFWAIILALSSYSFTVESNIMHSFPNRNAILFAWPPICYLLSCLFSSIKSSVSTKNLSEAFLRISLTLFLISVTILDLVTFKQLPAIEIFHSVCVASFLAIIIAIYKERATKKILLCSYLIIPILIMMMGASNESDLLFKFIRGGFSMTILTLFAFHAIHQKRRKFFNFFIFLISIRFLIFYFQALGGLATTGIGLILFGFIILSFVFLFRKFQFYNYFAKKIGLDYEK